MAERGAAGAAIAAGTTGAGAGNALTESGPVEDEVVEGDEDVPVWRTLSKSFEEGIAEKKKAGNGGAEAAEPEPPPDPRIERVLRLFRGTIVK